LERKAQLYDRLAAGQHDDEDEMYNVDFVRKGTLDDEGQEMRSTAREDRASSYVPIDSTAAATRRGGRPALLLRCNLVTRLQQSRKCLLSLHVCVVLMIGWVSGMTSNDMQMEQQRRQWEEDEWNDIERRKQEEARRDEKIEVGMTAAQPPSSTKALIEHHMTV